MASNEVTAIDVMGEFVPLDALWSGESAAYPSEQSARWMLHKLRPALAAADALAVQRGRVYVHPQRLAEVVRRNAVQTARKRSGL